MLLSHDATHYRLSAISLAAKHSDLLKIVAGGLEFAENFVVISYFAGTVGFSRDSFDCFCLNELDCVSRSFSFVLLSSTANAGFSLEQTNT